jgi:selenobiotic family peptide radical SAM maturase
MNRLYAAAAERGFDTAVLGNPAPKERIQELKAIQHPSFFQVSLEGLRETNDHIRGTGHYDRSLEFLQVLQDLDIYTMVMLTLTRDNIHQVIPLAQELQGRADSFTFNRLSLVGEGASLKPVFRDEFERFLEVYSDSARDNPMIGLKDNLINISRHRKGIPLFGGCTGNGCGAAFNFMAVLPNGDVHACRKFPSHLGNLLTESLSEIYDSETAERYRSGSRACRACPVRVVCRGCLAVTYSHGLDVFEDRDPYCFLDG